LLACAHARADALWGDQPQSICILPPPSHGLSYHISARLVVHAQGGVLADPMCPGRTLLIKDFSQVRHFLKHFDPDGKRFGEPGTGTRVDIVLHGQVDNERVVAISQVDAYARQDVIDRRWRIASNDDWLLTGAWQADEQFPFTPTSRTLKSTNNRTKVHGKLGDQDVATLLMLSKAEVGTVCQVSESPQSLVRLQCIWPLQPSDHRVWVYAREGETWRLVQKTDSLRP
jgi:hypothetical protein